MGTKSSYLHMLQRIVGIMVAIAVILGALHLLHKQVENITLATVLEAMRNTSITAIAVSAVATLLSFIAISVNEIIAVHTLTEKQPNTKTAVLAGATGNALCNTLGFHALTLTAWRYRVYACAGVGVADIMRISGITLIAVVLGFGGVIAVSLAFAFDLHASIPFLEGMGAHLISGSILGVIVFLLFLSWKYGEIRYKRYAVTLPRPPYDLLQIIVVMIDIFAAAYALYVLLPQDIVPGFISFACIFTTAALLGIVSHAPAGIGVLEAGIMTALGAEGRSDVLAALLLYRIIFNLIPFGLACIVVAVHSMQRKK